jgi:hypothetical protein
MDVEGGSRDGGLMEEDGAPKKKEPYESPQVTVISLRPEEAVLGACKNTSSAGPVASSCTAVGPCMTPGS